MKRTTQPRRGSCLSNALIGLAVVGLLLLIAGAVTFVAMGPSKAGSDFATKLQAVITDSTVVEAPGSAEIEFKAGGAAFLLWPNGQVGDKTIPMPPSSVSYTVTVKDADGNELKTEPNRAPRGPADPLYLISALEIPKDGVYTVDVTASDGSTPAAILAGAAGKKDLEELARTGITASIGWGGGCTAVCGFAMLLVFGIAALLARKSAKPDPLAM
jgi:hypothetical protein